MSRLCLMDVSSNLFMICFKTDPPAMYTCICQFSYVFLVEKRPRFLLLFICPNASNMFECK